LIHSASGTPTFNSSNKYIKLVKVIKYPLCFANHLSLPESFELEIFTVLYRFFNGFYDYYWFCKINTRLNIPRISLKVQTQRRTIIGARDHVILPMMQFRAWTLQRFSPSTTYIESRSAIHVMISSERDCMCIVEGENRCGGRVQNHWILYQNHRISNIYVA